MPSLLGLPAPTMTDPQGGEGFAFRLLGVSREVVRDHEAQQGRVFAVDVDDYAWIDQKIHPPSDANAPLLWPMKWPIAI